MEVIIKINGQALSVEVSVEVYEFLDRADHKEENLSHEQRRHWDIREFDEYIVAAEDRTNQETPEQYVWPEGNAGRTAFHVGELHRHTAPPVPALRAGRIEL